MNAVLFLLQRAMIFVVVGSSCVLILHVEDVAMINMLMAVTVAEMLTVTSTVAAI